MLNRNGINGKIVSTDMNSTRAKTLGVYLKSRRAQLQPEQAGLTRSHGQRRTPGLRREEVAILAGVSATYYTWLEQGREVAVSRDVIESIGRALQLNPDEHVHLLGLWNANEPEAVTSITTEVKPQWQEIVNQMAFPCFISNDRAELLAWNRAVDERIADFSSRPPEQRNMMSMLFTDPEMRSRLVNWEEMAAHSVAIFRTSYDKYSHDPWFAQFVAELSSKSAEFAALWKLHRVEIKKVTRVFYSMPGDNQVLAYDINSLAFTVDHSDLHLCIYSPAAD
ncbi:helix-turn-helix transcriptional regulator [Paenibacillus sp. WQ 127069]|uniref:Helix-turn-helix transcriptional regulator n=1 Tax=Paenibacillus baimaensis TaxID=2982185 RepID=A0ABT2UU25_9BACL|nr:helix-turn-helix transcriptional regulator [Paenibacillus sp. WQ 127069]MCU6798152.1 helix-turn-helix transcriptional regulator [Paenibacillus sp. WQ 127069]